MEISKKIANATRYVVEAAMRVFSPTDDRYPNTGVQPFTGTPYKHSKSNHW
ncbi:hypothetical protein [Calothrix sp. PCC 6303]|uniref:hypothetical protein n=1 Tax=Calothrix sp. PCC 6303 TaxID=1170562 RepID=UPI0002A01E34|nr:hypothetical protein [Calothrix sp. PCC 6303]AFZ03346.1 hypothetical protein Cal6303_4443 [Calothrix sp. PCC 6303]